MNQPGIFDEIVLYFRSVLKDFPDKRTGKNKYYQMSDAALSAFSVFFTQSPSFLAHQKSMAQKKGHDNAQSLFGIHDIPTDNHIRDLLDGVKPSVVFPVFHEIFRALEQGKYLEGFRSFKNNLLIALDGTEYFSSNQIHCRHCSSRIFRNGTTQYFHTVVTPAIVCPSNSQVIPLIPEFVVPQDGHDKQDSENAAAKRWIQQYGLQYASLGITILGDDLYCHQPLCELLNKQQLNFIFVCQPKSHITLYEWLEGMPLDTFSFKRWKGKFYEIYNYRYVNQIPLRDGKDAILVNWCELTVTRSDGAVIYKNSFATSHQITALNVEEIVSAGRARWKIENENNNTLKTKGYNLEHNFGHGKEHLSSLLATFNILAFLFHTLLDIGDEKYQFIRQHLPTRKTFFDDLRALTRYLYFENWENLLDFMLHGLELEFHPNTS